LDRPQHGGNLVWAAAVAGCPPADVLDFSASISPLGPPKSAIAAIVDHLQAVRAYPDPSYRELRTSLALAHQVPFDWILPGNGAAELLTLAARELSQMKITCLLAPAFGDYLRALKAFNAKVLECLMGDGTWGISDGAEIPFPIPDAPFPTSQMGLLLNNPHNPTGMLLSRQKILPLLEQFGLVVVDEAFMDFVPPQQQQSLIPLVQEYSNLVVVRSLTKFYSLPGLRLGYAIAHPDRLARWQQWRDPWPVNVLASVAAIAALKDTVFEQQTHDWLSLAKPLLFDGLAELPGLQPYPSAANFLLVKSEQSGSDLQEKLLQRCKILIRDCLSFPTLGDRFFRVAVRLPEENQRLIEALAQQLTVNC
jgi:L-threonine-O-3-phosphate decarboxylase